MSDGTRPIFWLDILLALAMAILAVLGKWEWVVVLGIAFVILNVFSRLSGHGGPKD